MLVPESDPEAGTRERVKLLDFGIAKVSSAPQGVNKADTQSDTMLGSPEYMSPEQCRGDRAIDAKADLYSLGVMLFRMLAGRLPFEAQGIGALMGMHIYEQPPELGPLAPGTPPELVQLVARMLSKDPTARPTALAAQQAMEQIGSRLGVPMASISLAALRSEVSAELLRDGARQGTPATAAGQAGARRRRVLPLVLGVAALCLIGGGAAAVLLRGGKAQPTGAAMGQGEPKPPTGRESAPPQQPVTAPDAPKKARGTWAIETEPPGAQIVRVSDGQVLGVTPWQGAQAEGDEPVQVRLRLLGYGEKALTLKPGADASYSQVLQRTRSGRKNPPVGKVGPKNRQDGKKNEPEIAD